MAFFSEISLDELLTHVRAIVDRDFSVGIESRSTLTDQDFATLRRLQSWHIQGSRRRRDAEMVDRRTKLLGCLLEHGATSGLYRAMREIDQSHEYPRPALADLWSFVPRPIVKRWIENAKTCGDNGVVGNLLCFAYERGDFQMLLRMFDYGVNCQATCDDGTELSEMKNTNRNSTQVALGMIRHGFEQAKAGLEPHLLASQPNVFSAMLHARDAQGCTILQTALTNGHLHTAKYIVGCVLRQASTDFALEPSEAMGCDELIAGCELRLNEIRTRLEHLVVDREDDVFQLAQSLFDAAAELLVLWRNYEGGMAQFFGEPHLAIVEEALEVLSDNQIARCREIWQKQGMQRSAASFVAELARTAIAEPAEAFLKAARGAKLHETADLGDLTGALVCVRAGARLDLRDRRNGGKSLLHRLVERGDEPMATLLLDAKADPRLSYYCQRTLLLLAVEQRSLAMAQAMLRNFVDPAARREYVEETCGGGRTALQLAARSGQLQMCKCLMRYQASYQRGRYASCDFSPAALATDPRVRALFALTECLAGSARGGDAKCLRTTLRSLPADELLAVCLARDQRGCDLASVARAAGHDAIAAEVGDLVCEAEAAAKSSRCAPLTR